MRASWLAAGLAAALPAGPALAADTAALPPPAQHWAFSGVFGRIDTAAARRGFTVFTQSCGMCHGLAYVHYRDLQGIGFTADEVQAIAAKAMVADGSDAHGHPIMRHGTPADSFHSSFPSAEAARAAFNGEVPPDLSLAVASLPGGPNYIYALLNGFRDPPAGFPLRDGMNYNVYYPGRQIAMAQPLAEQVPQSAHDVVTFLDWAAAPETNRRKTLGFYAIAYFLGMAGIAWAYQKRIWSGTQSD